MIVVIIIVVLIIFILLLVFTQRHRATKRKRLENSLLRDNPSQSVYPLCFDIIDLMKVFSYSSLLSITITILKQLWQSPFPQHMNHTYRSSTRATRTNRLSISTERTRRHWIKVSEIEYDESSKDDETGLLIMNMIDWIIHSQFRCFNVLIT